MALTIVLSVLCSLMANVVFLAVLTRIRPRLVVATSIARSVRNGKAVYSIKVINRAHQDVIDVQARLTLYRPRQVSGGPLKTRHDVPLRTSSLFMLPHFDKKDKDCDYAFRFTTTENLCRLLGETQDAYLLFQVIAKHSISGFSQSATQRYALAELKDGVVMVGNTMDIVANSPGDQKLLDHMDQEP